MLKAVAMLSALLFASFFLTADDPPIMIYFSGATTFLLLICAFVRRISDLFIALAILFTAASFLARHYALPGFFAYGNIVSGICLILALVFIDRRRHQGN
jgi:hypothetical protein